MSNVYLLLGGNTGNVELNFYKARILIQKLGEIVRCSDLYTSKAWGYESENMYVNQAILLKTGLTAHNLLIKLLEIESLLGRKRNNTTHYEDRGIDIDIIFYNDDIINIKNLVIPHPKMHERMFVLKPLSEIMDKEFKHPVLKKTIKEMMDDIKE